MAWIESHQNLKDHPKTSDLMAAMGWDIDTTIGKLHRFWWWCIDYAEDGDLRKHNDARIAAAMGVPSSEAGRLLSALISSGWVDSVPYLRIHDWWDYIGLFLQRRYRDASKWESIRDSYNNHTTIIQQSARLLAEPTYLTNLTKPNQEREQQDAPPVPPADDGAPAFPFAERPDWKEFWEYCRSNECNLVAEWYAKDKFEAAEQGNWLRQANWRAYARRCKGWWESDGRPMKPTGRNGKESKERTGPTLVEVQRLVFDKVKNTPQTQAFAGSYWGFWNRKEWTSKGKPLDWQSDLAIRLAKERFE